MIVRVTRRETLLDFFDDLAAARGEFLVYDNGFRSHAHTYADVARASRAFAARLHAAGLRKGDTVLFWSENRPEWIVALWGCLLQGIVAVPIDYRASLDFLRRVRTHREGAACSSRRDDVRFERTAGDEGLDVWPLAELDWRDTTRVPDAAVTRDDVAEIIFTSGATAEPKGVVITHRNLLANIVPVEREVLKYRKYARPFFPIRFLNLLPLSHMFGQSMATFIPPMLGGHGRLHARLQPERHRAADQRRAASRCSCRCRRSSTCCASTRCGRRRMPAEPPPRKEHFTRRWWRYRRVHRMFGLKFWAFVVGAAPLDPSLEEFWGRLGFVVVQGYGLTETAPIVSLNHPFSAQSRLGRQADRRRRGEDRAGRRNPRPRRERDAGLLPTRTQATAEAFEDGWFHTGDIGEVDAAGTPVHPRPQEGDDRHARGAERLSRGRGARARPRCPACAMSAVVGRRARAARSACTPSLVLEPGTRRRRRRARRERAPARSPADSRRLGVAAAGTAAHRGHTQAETPRRSRAWVATGAAPAPHRRGAIRRSRCSRAMPPVAPWARRTTIEELGLSSLERVELMVALEDQFQTTIDEAAFSGVKTRRRISSPLVRAPAAVVETRPTPVEFPRVEPHLARAAAAARQPGHVDPAARARLRVDPRRGVRARRAARRSGGLRRQSPEPPRHAGDPRGDAGRGARARCRRPWRRSSSRRTSFPPGTRGGEWFTNSLNYYLAAAVLQCVSAAAARGGRACRRCATSARCSRRGSRC